MWMFVGTTNVRREECSDYGILYDHTDRLEVLTIFLREYSFSDIGRAVVIPEITTMVLVPLPSLGSRPGQVGSLLIPIS